MRIATVEDVGEIVSMSMKFMDTTGYKEFSSEEEITALVIRLIVGNPLEYIIILEPGKGFLAGASSQFPFGPYRLATEIAWWVNPEDRKTGLGLELLHAFEYWAKEKAGCKLISMVGLDQGLDKLYTKQGYKLYEHAYMKTL